ncbi:MAG: segregation/condensation protein A [Planctomycetota bacterium]
MDYRVDTEIFHGPMDLLLHLIRRDEIDVRDIPIASVCDQFCHHVRLLQHLDIDDVGEFLVMAATLMEVKSAMLLPRPEAEEGAEVDATQDITDPRYELVQQLLEYKKLKDAAALLAEKQALREAQLPRQPGPLRRSEPDDDAPPPLDMEDVQVFDLLEAFGRLMGEVGKRPSRFHEVQYDETPIDLHAADIEDRLRRDGPMRFKTLLEGRTSRSEMIGVFLALLELIREKKIKVDVEDGADPRDPAALRLEAGEGLMESADDD